MPDCDVPALSRRRFVAASVGLAVAAAIDAHAAPLLATRRRLEESNAWIEVDRAVLDANIRLIRSMLAGGVQVCAVMKADAYGTGIALAMPSIIAAGFPYVGIASTEEARAARRSGFKGRLLRVRAATPDEVEDALPDKVEELAGNLAAALDKIAAG